MQREEGKVIKAIDLTGRRFGRLVAIERQGSKKGYATWLCKCDCGNEIVTRSSRLINGGAQSCGCLRNEMRYAKVFRHGCSNDRIYNIWRAMKARCYDKTHKSYLRYGGRGIEVCDGWRNDFITFHNWAMANGYQGNLTLDRKNGDGPYAPWNCRWVTQKEQCNNRRSSRFIEHNGEQHTIAEWATLLDISEGALRNRVRRGWDIGRVLTEPFHTEKSSKIQK